jgi:2-polyprenyl-3-methyl-5-hydroxy-6-metoxy-1,4-benzoquinol methylase
MSNTICPSCKSTEADIIYLVKDWYTNVMDNLFSVVRCKKCKLVRLDYSTTQECIEKIYPKEYFKQPNIISRFVKFILIKKEVMRWKKILTSQSKILEIGCGSGELLNCFYKIGKFDVVGIEQNEYICKFAKEKYGLEIINADIEEYDLGEKEYDLVLMQHVLEHLKDPISVIRKIHKSLKENGYLVIWIPFLIV